MSLKGCLSISVVELALLPTLELVFDLLLSNALSIAFELALAR